MPLNTASQIKAGLIAAFPKTSAPVGWLKCNGAAISRTAYAALFLEIGTTYGVGDGSTTFNLPELRGEFVRGLDDSRGIDTGRLLATAQADELKTHAHVVNLYNAAGGAYQAKQEGSNSFTGTANTSSTGGAETRPRNQALLMCIKY